VLGDYSTCEDIEMPTLVPDYPEWVTSPKRQPRRALAQKRLMFIVMHAAVQQVGTGSVSAFARTMGMERCTISGYIKGGRFSHPAAQLAETTFGAHLVRKEWLTDPLSHPA
jgi:hypothetical protein